MEKKEPAGHQGMDLPLLRLLAWAGLGTGAYLAWSVITDIARL